jgi:acylaminoacyl-peptidase
VVVALAVTPDCADLACSVARAKAKKESKASGVVYDRLFVRHWDAWADGTRNHLFVLALDGQGAPRDLMRGFDGDSPTKPFGDDEDFSITPDSQTVTFSAKIAGHDEAWSTNFDIFAVPLDGSSPPVDLTAANKATDTAPVYSPDGKFAAYRATKRPGFESDRYSIILRDEATGAEHAIAAEWDHSAQTLKWGADSRTLYTSAEDVGQTRLFAIDSQSSMVTALSGPGHVSAFDVVGDHLVYAQDDLTHPAQLFISDIHGGGAKALTSFNQERLKDVVWGDAEQFSFPGWNKEIVHGILVKPTGFDPARRYPIAFLIHGGPQGSFGNLFHYRWNAEAFAGAGYAVLMIDFHGSTGYGQGFTDAISHHWGDRPLEDLQKGYKFALSRYKFLDGDRACALGGSYGGFMINWIASQWNQPWKCLVNHDGIFDTRFMGYSTEELWFSEWENGGPPYQKGTDFNKFNPADHVDQWQVPTLVVEGGKDYRVPFEEALATFTALQRKGVPSKFLVFPDENHWVLKPQNVVQWYGEVIGWMDQWTAVR